MLDESQLARFFHSWWAQFNEQAVYQFPQLAEKIHLPTKNDEMVLGFWQGTLFCIDEFTESLSGEDLEAIQRGNESGDLVGRLFSTLFDMGDYNLSGNNVFGTLLRTDRGMFIPYLSHEKIFGESFSPELLSCFREKSLIEFRKGDNRYIRLNPYAGIGNPIGNGQTCSTYYIVAGYDQISTLVNDPKKIFEFGIGCGYQIVNFANMYPEASLSGADVFKSFCRLAKSRISSLDKLNGTNLSERIMIEEGNWFELDKLGFFVENSPYDIISVSFMLPEGYELNEMTPYLNEGGLIIAPVCEKTGRKSNPTEGYLNVVYKSEGGQTFSARLSPVCFVPAIRNPLPHLAR